MAVPVGAAKKTRSQSSTGHVVDTTSGFSPGGHGDELGLGVGGEQPQQLDAGVTGSADYGNANHELVVRPFYWPIE
jgi:hypothetical protein